MRFEDFDAWRRDPTTKYIFKAIERAQEAEKAEWERQSWDGGVADQHNLTVLKTRAEALGELIGNSFEDWNNWSEE